MAGIDRRTALAAIGSMAIAPRGFAAERTFAVDVRKARHDAPDSAESHLLGAPILTVPDKMKAASPLTYVRKGAPPFLIMHGLADNAVPYHQSVMLYQALTARHNDATLRLIDGLPHGFFDRSDTDDLAGPVRMQVSESHHSYEPPHYEQARVFDTALAFFKKHLG